jgi:WbqC-like protein family
VTATGRRVAIVQSNYVPWRGYFDLIRSVDEFILLDDAQYTKRDWRNRNRIKTPDGTRWLSIPVQVSGRYTQSISETRIADEDWSRSHWDLIRSTYANAPTFDLYGEFIRDLYASATSPYLSDINRHFLEAIKEALGIDTPLVDSRVYDPRGMKDERLLDLCLKAGAEEYVSGPSARAYLDEERFEARGVRVTWFEYGPYPEYDQIHPPFVPEVSILDVLLCGGADAPALVRPLYAQAR